MKLHVPGRKRPFPTMLLGLARCNTVVFQQMLFANCTFSFNIHVNIKYMQSLDNMNKKSIYQCNFFHNSIPLKRGLGFENADCQSQHKKIFLWSKISKFNSRPEKFESDWGIIWTIIEQANMLGLVGLWGNACQGGVTKLNI